MARHTQLYTDKCIPEGKMIVCVIVLFLLPTTWPATRRLQGNLSPFLEGGSCHGGMIVPHITAYVVHNNNVTLWYNVVYNNKRRREGAGGLTGAQNKKYLFHFFNFFSPVKIKACPLLCAMKE